MWPLAPSLGPQAPPGPLRAQDASVPFRSTYGKPIPLVSPPAPWEWGGSQGWECGSLLWEGPPSALSTSECFASRRAPRDRRADWASLGSRYVRLRLPTPPRSLLCDTCL